MLMGLTWWSTCGWLHFARNLRFCGVIQKMHMENERGATGKITTFGTYTIGDFEGERVSIMWYL